MQEQSSNKNIIVFSIQSLMDPLFQGLMYQYIRVHNEQYKGYTFHVFTEEHPEYQLSETALAQKKEELRQIGIIWYPLKYRNGRFLILKKIISIFSFLWQIRKVKKQYKAERIIGFLIMASTYCYLVSKLLRLKLFSFCFEPHSLYMKEFGIWSEKSLKYRILEKMEYLTAHAVLHITAPTIHSVALLQKWNIKGKISKVPISVDTEKFNYSEKDRLRIRQQFNIPDNRYALMYLGKFGGIYYNEHEVAAFCKRLINFDSNIFIFTVSPNPSEEVRQAYLKAGLAETDFVVLDKIPYDEIEGYISACDIGMVAIPPLDSQKYRTPVKIGNYLACGIPFIINRGIADDDILAKEEQVGVVFESLDAKENIDAALTTLRALMTEDRTALQMRCRTVAVKYRGIHNSVEVLNQMVSSSE